MTIGDALRLHPRAAEVLMSFHLGGCAHCGINEVETLEQVSAGYGVELESLLDALNDLFE
jgi:hybrid cluster-associated redox disulfide protein